MLRIDLFDLVDGLFRGVVYFFYNIFETIVHLVRRPFRGPIRLYQRRRQPGIRQLAGPTFLFLCFFAFMSVQHNALERHQYDDVEPEIGAELASAVTRTPSLDADWLWLVLATSLAATVIVDATFRLALSNPRFGGRNRRLLVIETVEYALFWPILLLLGMSIFPETLYPLRFAMTGWPDATALPLIPFFLLALVPAALLLAAGLRLPHQRRRRSVLRRLASLTAVTGIVSSAVLASGMLGQTILDQREQEQIRAADEGPLVLELDCALSDPAPHVDAIIWHRGSEPAVLQIYNFNLHIARQPDTVFASQEELNSAPILPLAFDDPPGPSILLQPGEARRIRLLVPGYRFRPGDAGKECVLRVYPGQASSALANTAVGGTNDTIEPPAGE